VELIEAVVYVRDINQAIDFYRDTLGLEVEYESEHWTTFRTGACRLALHPGTAAPDLTFGVSDIDSERARLEGVGVEVTEIRAPAPGVRVFDARDPDGNRFSLEARSAT